MENSRWYFVADYTDRLDLTVLRYKHPVADNCSCRFGNYCYEGIVVVDQEAKEDMVLEVEQVAADMDRIVENVMGRDPFQVYRRAMDDSVEFCKVGHGIVDKMVLESIVEHHRVMENLDNIPVGEVGWVCNHYSRVQVDHNNSIRNCLEECRNLAHRHLWQMVEVENLEAYDLMNQSCCYLYHRQLTHLPVNYHGMNRPDFPLQDSKRLKTYEDLERPLINHTRNV